MDVLNLDPEHMGRNLVRDPVTGELVDPETGEVVVDHPIVALPPRIVEPDEYFSKASSARVTMAVHDGGLWTTADDPKIDRLQRRLRKEKSRAMVGVLTKIWRVGRSLGVPDDVVEDAAIAARKALRSIYASFNAPKRWRSALAAAAILLAARSRGVSIDVDALTDALGIDRSDLWAMVRKLMEVLGIRVSGRKIAMAEIGRIAGRLGLPAEVRTLAERIVGLLPDSCIDGKSPRSIAAAAIYVAANALGYRVSQKELRSIAIIAEPTLRQRVKDILSHIEVTVEY